MRYKTKPKRVLLDVILWIAFGFTSYSAGAKFSVNWIAYLGMFAIVLTMVLREFRDGLHIGSQIANEVWQEKMAAFFEKLRGE